MLDGIKKKIAEGIDRIMPEESKKMAKERLSICGTCEMFNDYKCIKCGCSLDVKVYIPSSRCPLRKW